MGYTYKQGTLAGGTPATVYTCTSTNGAIIQSIRVNNPAAYVFTLNKYDATGVGLQIYQLNLSAGDTLTDSNATILQLNDYIELVSDVAGTNYILCIIEY